MNIFMSSWLQLLKVTVFRVWQNRKRNIWGKHVVALQNRSWQEVISITSFSILWLRDLYWLFPPGEEESRLWRLLSGAPLFNQTIIEGPHTGSHSSQQRALSPQSCSHTVVCLSVCLRGKRLLRQDAARWVWSAATFWTSEGVFSFLTSFPKNTQRSISFRSAAGFSPQHTVSPAGSAWSCVTKWTPPLTSTGLHKSLELNLSWDSWIAGNTLLNTTLQRCI